MKIAKDIGKVKSSKIIIVIICVTLVALAVVAYAIYRPLGAASLKDFYAWNGTPLTKYDPLIVMGDPIVPTLIEEIKNKEMPKRMVAIYFFGDFGYQDALPVLESILQDETEHEIDRAVVLYNIYKIDSRKGNKYAQMYREDQGEVGNTARSLLEEGVSKVERRSYIAATISYYSNGAIQIQE